MTRALALANSANLLDGGDLPWRIGNEPDDSLNACQPARARKNSAVASGNRPSRYRSASEAAITSRWLQ